MVSMPIIKQTESTSTSQIKSKSKNRLDFISKVLTIILILGVTSMLYLYTSGYRLNREKDQTVDLSKTGMISAKSLPDGASVYLDGTLVTATNDTLSGVIPGKHRIKIEKKGFVAWQKDIEVYEELVTDITAVLVSQSPRLEPLTNTGAQFPTISPDLSKIAYFSSDGEKPGIWVTPLVGATLSLFKTTPAIAIQDTKFTKYSEGKSIEWSPDEKSLLVQGSNDGYYIIDLDTNTAQTATDPNSIRQEWNDMLTEKRTAILDKLDIPADVKQLAVSTKSVWAPDDKKFLYTAQIGDAVEYRVYNFERPIPVGEKIENTVFTTKASDVQPKVTWYSDSFHLIIVEGNIAQDKRGLISLIRIDGTNKIEVYSNTLMSDSVFSAPSGDKLIVLTSFKSGDQTDLYTVGLR